MPTTKLKNGQLPDTISSKTVDNTNTINTTTTNLKISGGTNGQILSTDGSGNLSWKTDGVTNGDKGDITVSASGATWTIDNDAVTYAKIQNVTTSRLLGRGTAGGGDVQEITIGSGLTLTGTTLSASSSISYSENALGTDTLIGSSGSGVFAASLLLNAGTYLVQGFLTGYALNQNFQMNALIQNRNNGTVYASSSQSVVANGTSGQATAGNIHLSAIVVLTATNFVDLSIGKGQATNYNGNFYAAVSYVSANASALAGGGGTKITAIRLA